MQSAKYIWFLCLAAFVASARPGPNEGTKSMSSQEPGDCSPFPCVPSMFDNLEVK